MASLQLNYLLKDSLPGTASSEVLGIGLQRVNWGTEFSP